MGRNTAKKLYDQGNKPVQKMEKKPVRTYKEEAQTHRKRRLDRTSAEACTALLESVLQIPVQAVISMIACRKSHSGRL